MITHYKYIHFEQIERKSKTSVWSCLNSRSGFKLGEVRWYGAWRVYCFAPSDNTIFNVGCLDDIKHFIGQLSDERIEERRKVS